MSAGTDAPAAYPESVAASGCGADGDIRSVAMPVSLDRFGGVREGALRLDKVTITNYKSYDRVGPIRFDTGFNVIVGQNNSGKTALIEALTAKFGDAPHRHLSRPSYSQPPGQSVIEFELVLSGQEAKELLLSLRATIVFAVPTTWSRERRRAEWDGLLARDELAVACKYTSTLGILPQNYPSHGLFDARLEVGGHYVGVHPVIGQPEFTQDSEVSVGGGDTFGTLIGTGAIHQLYCFKAERLNVGSHTFAGESALSANAANLTDVLNTLQGANPDQLDIINEYVRRIFPNIRKVTTRPLQPGSNTNEIAIWTVDPSTHRQDLAMPLSVSGTGIGQVLAILYVVVTSVAPRIIIIDEPNTFLHPGAVRTLVNILKEAPLAHQYILSTHSAEIIAMTEPSTVHLVRWVGGRSVVESIDRTQIVSMRAALEEIGTRLSDVFGADRVLWVEGPTEAACFPLILKKAGKLPAGVVISGLNNTGEIFAKKAPGRAIGEIYRALSNAHALLPTTLAFCFDREGRTDREIEDLSRSQNPFIRFIPRRLYENYLLEADAVAELISTLDSKIVTGAAVMSWFVANGTNPKYLRAQATVCAYADPMWLIQIDGANLLKDLFLDMTEARCEYVKTAHGPMLTKWILEHKPETFAELVEFLSGLVLGSPR